MNEQIRYCRVALPEGGDAAGNLAATRLAVMEVLIVMERANVDPRTGQFRATYNMDSNLERESVLVEWKPNTEPKAEQPSPHRDMMPFMTVIPTRRPTHKVHVNIGHAKNAINNALYGTWSSSGTRERMELCEWVEGKGWVTKYDFPPGAKHGETPWRKK